MNEKYGIDKQKGFLKTIKAFGYMTKNIRYGCKKHL